MRRLAAWALVLAFFASGCILAAAAMRAKSEVDRSEPSMDAPFCGEAAPIASARYTGLQSREMAERALARLRSLGR